LLPWPLSKYSSKPLLNPKIYSTPSQLRPASSDALCCSELIFDFAALGFGNCVGQGCVPHGLVVRLETSFWPVESNAIITGVDPMIDREP